MKHRELRLMLKWTFRLSAGLGILVALLTTTPFVSWYARILAGPWSNPRGELLIVLGGSAWESEIIGESTYLRAVYALRAYREGGFRKIVLSGAGVSWNMREFLVFQGIPAESVQLEGQSRSTRENAVYTWKLLDGSPDRKVLLTSDYHMFRAYRTFSKAGLQVLPRPIPDAIKRAGRWPSRWSVFLDEAIETVKIVYYFGRGWI